MRRAEVERRLKARERELARLGVRSLALFGSVARDEAGPESDVDLLVEFARPVGFFEFADVKDYLEGVLGRPVDLGTYESLKPRIRDRVLAEAYHVATGLAGMG